MGTMVRPQPNAETPLPLKIAACFFGLAALFHLERVIFPGAGEPSATLRHAVFVGINLTCIAGLLLRPPLFKYVFGLLVVQQIYGHGGSAWQAWALHREIDYVSLFIVIMMPLTWAVLWGQSSRRSD
jgi:hypothetical protein